MLKRGTKVKGLRLVGGDYEVNCKIDGGGFNAEGLLLKMV